MANALIAVTTEQSLAAKVTEIEIKELNALVKSRSDSSGTQVIESKLDSKSPLVKSLAALLLYRADPKRYDKELYDCFAVHDYLDRSRSKYNMIEPNAIVTRLEKIEAQFPVVTDKRLQLLPIFHHYRDKNNWTTISD